MTRATIGARAVGAGALVVVFVAVACSPAPPETVNPCNGATTGSRAVVCPGTIGCTCAAPNVCCMGAIDSRDGACQDPRTCSGIEVTCDGPEDCGGGVCCLTATGSSCTDKAACSGNWLCRGDAHCIGSPNGPSCVPADYGRPGVGDRGLDGAIGICRHD